MDILIGIILGLIIVLSGKVTRFENNRWFYPAILIVIGLLYILFGIFDGKVEVIVFETFFAAIFDVFHNFIIENSGVPNFYPQFCLAVDFVLAFYLDLTQLTKSRNP